MKFLSQKSLGIIVILTFSMVFGSITVSSAQKVPINFNDFHGYTGTIKYIKEVSQAYPNLTELQEIGKSSLGRSIYVLVITNMKTGTTLDAHVELRNIRKEYAQNVTPMKPYQGKPGHWINGCIHGNEFTSTEVCLYIIDKLLNGYGADSHLTRLVDNNTFYFCPIINPDGAYNSVERDIAQRQNSEFKDDDGDGLINEDGLDDINNDGHITQFRYKDPEGNYVIDDVDPRHMVKLDSDDTTKKQRYSMVREDIDNDGDGHRGEDGEKGIDLNRNFPTNWLKADGRPGGSGDYPTSASETHAVYKYFKSNPNILIAMDFHTRGGFTYRPMDSEPDSYLDPRDVAIYDRIMGKKFLELMGFEVPEAWKAAGPLDEFKEQLRQTTDNPHTIERGYELPTGWIHGYDEAKNLPDGYGMLTDWMYDHAGTYGICVELWNSRRDMKGINEFTGPDADLKRERALLKYQDEEFGGKFFLPWKRYNHPELGEGEIGGWIPRYRGNNAFPGETLVGVCDTQYKFEIFRAGLLPDISITDAKARILYKTDNVKEAIANQQGEKVTISKGKTQGKYKIVEVSAVVENKGKLATRTARGAQLPGYRQDAVWLIGDRDKITFLKGSAFQSIGVLEGTMPIPGYERPAAGQQQQERQGMRQRPTGGDHPPTQLTGSRREIKWFIAIEGDSLLKVVVSSQKGGTKVKEISIR